jgi:uncharacterized protein YggT (Ycf19 family)
MNVVDLLLNLAGLLLWLGWRAIGLAEPARAPGLSLASTLQRAAPLAARRWPPLAWLAALLLVRPLLYWQIGTPTHWNPLLGLGLIAIPFRTTSLGHMLLYSLLGFGRVLALFHLALLCLCLVNRRVSDADAVQRFVRLQLGRVTRWPAFALVLLPLGAGTVLWLIGSPLLIRMELLSPPAALGIRLQQGLLLGAAACLTWVYPIAGLLAGYFFYNHVFVGHSSLWSFVGVTGRNLLRPLRWLPLVAGRLDFAPLLALALVVAAGHYALLGLTRWFEHPPF